MAVASPSLILLTGQNYVAAPLGMNLDGGVNISIAVVFDPGIIGNNASCTVISKHNPGAGKYGWLISYDALTGFVTGTVYDSAAGTNSISVVSILPIKGRSVVVLTFSTTSTIRIYVNGVPADGVITGSVPSSIAFNNEPLAFGADSTSTTAANPMVGSVYYAAIWRVQLTASEVATIGADAVTPVPLQAVGYQLVLAYTSAAIVSNSFGTLLSWTDSIQGLVATPGAVAGAMPRVQSPTSPLLIVDEWTTSLADAGDPGGWPLSTTYALAVPYRLWANGATPPQTAAFFRTSLSDVTLYARARRIAGQATTIIFETLGISLEYDFATKELFAIIGDDQTGTNKNRRVSFGTNIFNIEGVAADFALRVNSVTLEADLFIGAIKYTPVSAVTNANVQTTPLILAQQADLNFAAIVPACLNDAQTFSLIAHNEVSAVSRGFIDYEYVSATNVGLSLEDILAALPTPIYIDSLPVPAQSAPIDTIIAANYPALGGFNVPSPGSSDSTTVTMPGGSPPNVTNAFLLLCQLAQVGDILQVRGDSNANANGDFRILAINLGVPSLTIARIGLITGTGSTTATGGGNGTMTLVRQVNVGKSRAFEVHDFTSSPYPVIDDPVRAYVDPLPVVTSIVVDGDHIVTGVATAGPTDAYLTYNYWEIELESGVSVIVIDEQVSTRFFAGRASVTNLWDVPSGSLWNGLRIRFVIQAVQDSAQIWYSPWVTLADQNFNNGGGGGGFGVGTYLDPLSSVQSVTVDAMHNVTAVVMSGPINPAGSSATTHYWEIEMDSGAVFVNAGEQTDGLISASRVQITNTFTVPLGESWACRRIRFVVVIQDDAKRHGHVTFRSPWYSLQDPAFNKPGLPPQVVPIWPGAVNPVSDIPIVPTMAQDLYDVVDFTFRSTSALYPVGSLINEQITAIPSIISPQWFDNGKDHPPGLYTITYTSGARHNLTSNLWNDFFQGAFGTGSRGMWIQSGMNRPYYVFQGPAFVPGGYNSQANALAAAVGYSFIFYHIGGPIGVVFDNDNCSYVGNIGLTLNDTQGIDIPGSWQILEGPGSPTIIGDPSVPFPTIHGLRRGQTHLRYIVRGLDKKPRWQDCYVRVWPGPTHGTATDRSDPKSPKPPVPADTTGSGALIHPR